MNFTLNVLGTASALPTTERYPSAQVLNVRGRLFMIDCGEAAQIQIRKAGISFLKIEHICISHIHGDHIFGFFGLLSTMAMLGRSAPLAIYGPKGFLPVLEFFKSTFGEGILFDIDFTALEMSEPEVIYENRNVELLAFPLNHRVETFGYMIREKMPQHNVRKEAIAKYGLSIAEIGALKRGEDVIRNDGSESSVILNSEAAYIPYVPRSYAYCSDTAPCTSVVEHIKGVDLLYHETTFAESEKERAAQTYHSTARQAAQVASEACVKRLLIGHYSSRYETPEILLNEARELFPETICAKEGMVVSID